MILEFRSERLSTGFQPLGLEMSNVWLGEELQSRDEKEVIKRESEAEDVTEQANGFSSSSGGREAQGLISRGRQKTSEWYIDGDSVCGGEIE